MDSKTIEELARAVARAVRPGQTPKAVDEGLRAAGFRQPERARRNIEALISHATAADTTATASAFEGIVERIVQAAANSPDPDMALNNLERLFDGCESPRTIFYELASRPLLLEEALYLFGSSQSFSDIVIELGHFDWLDTGRQESPEEYRRRLCEEFRRAVLAHPDRPSQWNALRRSKHLETVRIGWDDVLHDRPIEDVTRRISLLAEAVLETALAMGVDAVRARLKLPADCPFPELCILGLGKLGGEELNYSSDIDVGFIYDEDRELPLTHRGGALTHEMLANEVVSELLQILTTPTEAGLVYRVDTRLRPEGRVGRLARSVPSYLQYYASHGQAWERQALVKARPVAGATHLGHALLARLQPFIYPRYLKYTDITELQSLKRHIEALNASGVSAGDEIDVKLGPGGIRDIEYVVQFLQLLHGGELLEARHHNTLTALRLLEQHSCLPPADASALERAYRFLRKTEHRLMILYQLQVHQLPADELALAQLARRMGFSGSDDTVRREFLSQLHEHRATVRRIFSDLFTQYLEGQPSEAAPEVDLILQPEPPAELVERVLSRYGLQDTSKAYQSLMCLARESSPLLATPRTRALLAQIAPALLSLIAQGPDPDMALLNLERCVESLGAKTIFFELLHENRRSLELFVDLCSWSQFLTDILVQNPGMLDQLMDSLMIGGRKDLPRMERELHILLTGAADPLPILHGYRNGEWLRIGVRDILGSADIEETMRDLSNLAQALVRAVCSLCEAQLVRQLGTPQVSYGSRGLGRAEFAVIALGKFGGAEITYGSDLDLVFIYSRDGQTTGGVANQMFFTALATEVTRVLSSVTPHGQLYRVDPRLRPDGSKGMMVSSIEAFRKYFEQDRAQLWERQAFTRARFVAGDGSFGREVAAWTNQQTYGSGLAPSHLADIAHMRHLLEKTVTADDIKRGPSGIVDIEFIVQALQLQHGHRIASLQTPNTAEALRTIGNYGILPKDQADFLLHAYRFLRLVETRLRIVSNIAHDELPRDLASLCKLARRVGYSDDEPERLAERFAEECRTIRRRTREFFNRVFRSA